VACGLPEALVLQEFSQIVKAPIATVKREIEKIYFQDWSDDVYARANR
jgi:hypothetical protein